MSANNFVALRLTPRLQTEIDKEVDRRRKTKNGSAITRQRVILERLLASYGVDDEIRGPGRQFDEAKKERELAKVDSKIEELKRKRDKINSGS